MSIESPSISDCVWLKQNKSSSVVLLLVVAFTFTVNVNGSLYSSVIFVTYSLYNSEFESSVMLCCMNLAFLNGGCPAVCQSVYFKADVRYNWVEQVI